MKLFGFEFFKDDSAYKADNLKLMGQVSSLQHALESVRQEHLNTMEQLQAEATRAKKLEQRIKELEADDSQKVTYANARKTMTKAKLKDLRASLEAVPSGATGFSASVSVYDKKTKRLKVVQLKSKTEALELVGKAEKGHVEIVI